MGQRTGVPCSYSRLSTAPTQTSFQHITALRPSAVTSAAALPLAGIVASDADDTNADSIEYAWMDRYMHPNVSIIACRPIRACCICINLSQWAALLGISPANILFAAEPEDERIDGVRGTSSTMRCFLFVLYPVLLLLLRRVV